MAKHLILICYNESVLKNYIDQIKTFMPSPDVYWLRPGGEGPELPADENVVLAETFEGFMSVKDRLKGIEVERIIYAGLTVSAGGVRSIERIPEGADVIVYQSDFESATRASKIITKVDRGFVNVTPAGSLDGIDLSGKCIATTHDHIDELKKFSDVYDIGYSVFDLETLLDIADAFNIRGVLEQLDMRAAPAYLVPMHEGLFKNLEQHNRYISANELLMKMLSGAIISVDKDGNITAVNDQCEKQLGVKAQYIVGKNGNEIFPFIQFREALERHRSVDEYVCRYRDEDLIVSVAPKTNAGKYYGAIAVVKRFREEEKRHRRLKGELMDRGYVAKYTFDDIIGSSKAMKETKDKAMRMARSDSSVLITGENGTGKEMFAQAIHNASTRAGRQFVAVNCGAIPANLLESELFGYEEGAFTGALKGGKAGIFEMASTGTLFLDEISEMDMALQQKLLRVLQEKEVVRVGGNYVIPVNCRIIASSNRDLGRMVADGKFRMDLYYRLRVLPLRIPPLRERKEDIPDLINSFEKRFGSKMKYTSRAREMVEAHEWYGNVRELRNCVEYLAELGKTVVDAGDLEEILGSAVVPASEGHAGGQEERRAAGPEGSGAPGDRTDEEECVLEILREGFAAGKRLGRRSIAKAATERGMLIGEQRVRMILTDLERRGMVTIGKGKAGTVLTKKGLRLGGGR
ncbi:MAG: sigma 54-interacting transcriptional regulator [Anaerovoracaceae bacterium]|jgi:PAS domain S-box-containing protein